MTVPTDGNAPALLEYYNNKLKELQEKLTRDEIGEDEFAKEYGRALVMHSRLVRHERKSRLNICHFMIFVFTKNCYSDNIVLQTYHCIKLMYLILFNPAQSGRGIPLPTSRTQVDFGDPSNNGSQVESIESRQMKELEKIYADKKDCFEFEKSTAENVRKYIKILYRLIKFPSEVDGMFEQPNFVRPQLKDNEGKYIYNSQAVKICDFLMTKFCKYKY